MLDAALLETRGGAWGFGRKKKQQPQTNETDTDTTNTTTATEDVVVTVSPREEAAQYRSEGKANHDNGEFIAAAEQFQTAANLLEKLLKEDGEEESTSTTGSFIIDIDTIDKSDLRDEWATCRLHESLCHLKAEQYDQCIEACNALVDQNDDSCAPVFRARAYHRRAKAKLALDDTDGALLDARSAAFLGDRKAVTFYGKLLRETGGGIAAENPLEAMFSSSGSSGMEAPPMDSLMGSLLSKSSLMDGAAGSDPGTDFLTSSLLGSLGGGTPDGGGSLAKSLLKNLSKKLDDESTHDGICRYLQSANALQLQSMSKMAGIELSSDQASRLINMAHGVTPKTIRFTVKNTKRAIWGVQLIRKTMALLSKYRHILFLLVLLQWTKSAVFRPIPVPKGAKVVPPPKIATKPGVPVNNNNNNGPGAAAANGKKPVTPGLLNNNPMGGARERLAGLR
ncbi:expressed unknown protein [Seminavis robusta]|uniref:Uncharacterized protein n=1 Tax=Seminavis robusta TaxID=568900 RepID=A0A9N8EII4_9STRA|nr:expressed unknown protein [Seminavis robusta]|eukprot:Sro1225_g254060.1 n/a (452) ;mRNA; f:6275-7630